MARGRNAAQPSQAATQAGGRPAGATGRNLDALEGGEGGQPLNPGGDAEEDGRQGPPPGEEGEGGQAEGAREAWRGAGECEARDGGDRAEPGEEDCILGCSVRWVGFGG